MYFVIHLLLVEAMICAYGHDEALRGKQDSSHRPHSANCVVGPLLFAVTAGPPSKDGNS